MGIDHIGLIKMLIIFSLNSIDTSSCFIVYCLFVQVCFVICCESKAILDQLLVVMQLGVTKSHIKTDTKLLVDVLNKAS